MKELEAVLRGHHHVRDDTPATFSVSVIPLEPPPGEETWLEARLVVTYRLGDQTDEEEEVYSVQDWRWHNVEVFAENCAYVAEIDATRLERTAPWPTLWGAQPKPTHSTWVIPNVLPPVGYRVWSYMKKGERRKVLDLEYVDEDNRNLREHRLTTSDEALRQFAVAVMEIRRWHFPFEEAWCQRPRVDD